MFPATPHRPHTKHSILLAYAVCPLLLIVSSYGFWKVLHLSNDVHILGMEEVFYLLCLVIIPLVMFLFLSVVAGQRIEYDRFSASYQTRVDQLQKRLNAQEDLLHLVTGSDPASITVFDQNKRFWFVNASAAREAKLDVHDMIGQSIGRFADYDRTQILDARLTEVLNTGQSLHALDQRKDAVNGQIRFVQTQFEKIAPFAEFIGGVMVRSEDVTSLIVERERRENMLRQVIATLVAVVDRRDPYASGHSERVGQLSRVIAEELLLSEQDIETAQIAGSLMNFGKVLVPREILTKTTALSPEELQRVRDSILTSADILSMIHFSGPIVPTLRQVLERYDGTGVPNGLKGDAILITARIVAVANAFVALVSTRAHRPSLHFSDAITHVMADADKIYDRRVVTALANYIANRATKLDWLQEKPTAGR